MAAEGIRPWDLLKGISKEIKKKKEKVKGYRYFGNGQYEKITECNERIVEYRGNMVVLPQPGIRKKEEPLIVEVNMVLSPSMRLVAILSQWMGPIR